jgi:hypothetical protein
VLKTGPRSPCGSPVNLGFLLSMEMPEPPPVPHSVTAVRATPASTPPPVSPTSLRPSPRLSVRPSSFPTTSGPGALYPPQRGTAQAAHAVMPGSLSRTLLRGGANANSSLLLVVVSGSPRPSGDAFPFPPPHPSPPHAHPPLALLPWYFTTRGLDPELMRFPARL